MNTTLTPNVIVKPLSRDPIDRQEYEMCEHKGIGHPDTITDAVCEAASRELSLAYRERFGQILHHNLDKGLLIAGSSAPRFGGGTIIEPMKIIICGRATTRGGKIDVREIAIAAAQCYLQRHIRCDPDHFTIETEIKEGSGNLKAVMPGRRETVLANDTSFGVGFAPYSRLEQIVLRLAEVLKSDEFRRNFPAAGDDFKIMAHRSGSHGVPVMTVALAMIDKHVQSPGHYFLLKQAILDRLLSSLATPAEIRINVLDDVNSKDEHGIYLTVTGLSAEMGDDGQVGRGNRASSLITPNRAMSLEAVAGKNPVSHVGKIYNVMATLMARDIHENIEAVEEINVLLLSAIGRPIGQPQAAVAELSVKGGITATLDGRVRAIVHRWLTNTDQVTDLVLSQKAPVF
jgi:S-adenosylmethionine synthetase